MKLPPSPYRFAIAALLLALSARAQTVMVWTGAHASSNGWILSANWSPAGSPHTTGTATQVTDASPMTGASATAFAPGSLVMNSAPASGTTPNVFTLTATGSATKVFWFKDATDSLRVQAGTLVLASNATGSTTLTAGEISVISRSGLARELATLEVNLVDSSTITNLTVGDGMNAANLNAGNSTLSLSGTLTAGRYSAITLDASTLSAVTSSVNGSLTATDSSLSFNSLSLGADADLALTGSRLWLGSTPVITSGGQFHGTALFSGSAASAAKALFTVEGTFESDAAIALANGTTHVLSNGPAVLGSALTLSSGFISSSAADIATVSAPNGVRVSAGHSVAGTGLIYGVVTDETNGSGLAGSTSQWEIDYAFAAGSDHIALVGSPIFKQGLTISGGTMQMLGPVQYQVQGTGLSGHGAVGGQVQLSATAGSPLNLDGNLILGTSGGGTVGLQGGRSYNVGTHTLTLADGAQITGGGSGTFQLSGGRVIADGNGLLNPNTGLVTLSGHGLLLDTLPNRFQPGDVTVAATGALTLTDNLPVGGRLAVFVSNAAVNLGPQTTLAAGTLFSANGYTLAGNDTISGNGLIHGTVTDSTGGAGGLVASGTFNGGSTVFGLGAGSTRVLSVDEAVFTFTDTNRTGALTLVAPNGVSLVRDTMLSTASSHALTVEGDLGWRGGDLPATLTVTGNLTGQGLFVSGATSVGGTFHGSGFFGTSFAAGTVIPEGSVSMGAYTQPSGATTRLIAGGVTTTSSDVTLNGGTLQADNGLRFSTAAKLRGHGTLTGYAAGGNGRVTGLTGNLTIDALGAGGTVAFEQLDTYEVFDTVFGPVTLSVLADTAISTVTLDVSPGATFSTSNGAASTITFLGWSAPGSGSTSLIRGPLSAGELRVYNRGDFDALSADSGFVLHSSVARDAVVLGSNNGNVQLGSGGAFTFGTTGGLTVPAGGGITMDSGDARIVGDVQLDGTANGSALSVAGQVTGTGTFGSSMTLLANAQALDFNGAVAVAQTSSGLNPGRVGEAGELTFSQNLTLAGNSVLTFELGGTTRGTGYDAIDVGGTLTFGGTLTVNYVSAFVPQSGAVFDLFNTGAVSGTFASLNLPSLASGLSWDTTALHTSGLLGVTGTAIPEPSTYVTLAGLLALGLAAWRRR